MHWNAETSAMVLRGLPDGAAYGAPFIAIVFVKTVGPGVAFLEGALRVDGHELSVRDWRSLARKLRAEHGIERVRMMRHGRAVEHLTARAGPLQTSGLGGDHGPP
ncbi:MAG: hypothetical protein C0423_19785 [Methylibium sp.]|nr:hypothetical protein [Methylibium sp.]